MLYTLCYFENDFCLKFVHGEQLRPDLRNRSSKIELLSIGKKTSFSFAPFHSFKNDFALRQLFHCKKQLKEKRKEKKKNTMKAHRLMLGNCEEELPQKTCRPTVCRLLADCWPSVSRLLAVCRPTDGRQVFPKT